MNNQNLSLPTFGVDDLLKGAVFVLGALFGAYCILHALFGEYWSLMIARALVVLSLVAILYAGFNAIRFNLQVKKHLSHAKIRKAYAGCDIHVVQDPKGLQQVIYDARNKGWKHFFKPGSAKLLDKMSGMNDAPVFDFDGNRFDGNQSEQQKNQHSEYLNMKPLLPKVLDYKRLLILGGSGVGKSSLMRWIVEETVKKRHVAIIDPHAAPMTWPEYCQVVGMGRNYQEIQAFFDYIVQEIDKRYNQLASGQKQFAPITVVIDEMFVLNQMLDITDHIKQMLCEVRKINIGLVMAGQSDRVDSIGLSGNKDLIQSFEAICQLQKERDEATDEDMYFGIIRNGSKKEEKYRHPGPFEQDNTHIPPGKNEKNGFFGQKKQGGNGGNGGKSGYRAIPMGDIDVSGRDAEIIDLYRQGSTVSKIRKKIFGGKGGMQLRIIRDVLARHGIA